MPAFTSRAMAGFSTRPVTRSPSRSMQPNGTVCTYCRVPMVSAEPSISWVRSMPSTSTEVTRSPLTTQHRLRRRLGQQAEGAGGTERLVLAEVLDPRTERAAVAEMVLDHVRRGSRRR